MITDAGRGVDAINDDIGFVFKDQLDELRARVSRVEVAKEIIVERGPMFGGFQQFGARLLPPVFMRVPLGAQEQVAPEAEQMHVRKLALEMLLRLAHLLLKARADHDPFGPKLRRDLMHDLPADHPAAAQDHETFAHRKAVSC